MDGCDCVKHIEHWMCRRHAREVGQPQFESDAGERVTVREVTEPIGVLSQLWGENQGDREAQG